MLRSWFLHHALDQLFDRARRLTVRRPSGRSPQEYGLHAGRTGTYDINVVEVADVQGLVCADSKRLERGLEDSRIRLFYADESGVNHHVKVLQ